MNPTGPQVFFFGGFLILYSISLHIVCVDLLFIHDSVLVSSALGLYPLLLDHLFGLAVVHGTRLCPLYFVSSIVMSHFSMAVLFI